jgi:AcrR family transcriptional regulator
VKAGQNPQDPASRRGAKLRKLNLPIAAEELHPTAMKLLDAASRLVERSGVDSLSFYAIGREAGVSPSLVWYHFGSKSELLLALSEWQFHNELDFGVWRHDGSHRPENLWELLAEQSKAALEDQASYRLYYEILPHLLGDQRARDGLAQAHRAFSQTVASAFDAAGSDPGAADTIRLLAILTSAMTDGLAIWLQADSDSVDVEEAVSLWMECVANALQRRRDSGG